MPRSPEGTTVEYLILADSAEVVDGRLDMTGGDWDTLLVQDLARPVRLAFACGVHIPWAETEKDHSLALSLDRADGRPLFRLDPHTFRTGRPQALAPGSALRLPIAVTWEVRFPEHGRYRLTSVLDSRRDSARSVEFSVLPAAGAEPVISEEEENFFDEEMGLVG